jgi:hypothetical protein
MRGAAAAVLAQFLRKLGRGASRKLTKHGYDTRTVRSYHDYFLMTF